MAQSAAEEKIDLTQSKIRTLIVAGEPGGSVPVIRKKIEGLWPAARVFDHHGMTEVGPVTHECSTRPGVLHVLEPDFFAEVCNGATGAPVPPGQTGELVLTTLARVDSPVLRYRTGDLVRLGKASPNEPCACGRATLTLEGGILGRLDDMVVVRGVNIFPAGVDAIIQQFPGIAEYQVRVDTKPALAEISVTIEPGPECKDPHELVSSLERSFQTALALRVTVTVVPVGSLPRSEMKAQRWLKVN